VGDLLDFGNFESHSGVTKTVTATSTAHDPFVADFGAFSSSNTADTAATTSSTVYNYPTSSTVSSSSSSIQQQPAFDPFSSSTVSTTNNHCNNNNDPFAPNPMASVSQPSVTQKTDGMPMNVMNKQPIMATSFSNNQNAISNAFASPSMSSSTMMMSPTSMNGWMPQQQQQQQQQQFMMMMGNHNKTFYNNIQNPMMSGGIGMNRFASSIIPNAGITTTSMMGSPSLSINNNGSFMGFSNTNAMQPMSSNYSNTNNISSSFGSMASTAVKKDDPFAGLGFK
jgi:hypothetical protein